MLVEQDPLKRGLEALKRPRATRLAIKRVQDALSDAGTAEGAALRSEIGRLKAALSDAAAEHGAAGEAGTAEGAALRSEIGRLDAVLTLLSDAASEHVAASEAGTVHQSSKAKGNENVRVLMICAGIVLLGLFGISQYLTRRMAKEDASLNEKCDTSSRSQPQDTGLAPSQDTALKEGCDAERGVILHCFPKTSRSVLSCSAFLQFLLFNRLDAEPSDEEKAHERTLLHAEETRRGFWSGVPREDVGVFCTIMSVCGVVTLGWLVPAVWLVHEGQILLTGLKYALLGYASQVLLHGAENCLRLVIYWCGGLSYHSQRLVCGPRQQWTKGTVDGFINEYGERRIKAIDAINRRMGHVLDHAFRDMFFIPFAVPTQTLRVYTTGFSYMMKVVEKSCLLRSDHFFASSSFQGARIRDGRLGRANLITVTMCGCALYPIALLMLVIFVQSRVADLSAVVAFVFQPTAWGDTAGELFGSFFGRLEFKVKGMGEINRKTIEGCIACWAASFAGCIAFSMHPNFPHADMFLVSIPVLCTAVATAATFAEVLSFRGTDNGFMVLASVAVVVALMAPIQPGVPTGFRNSTDAHAWTE